MPMTFVADGCPMLVIGFEDGLEVRLSGRVVAANRAQIERVLLAAVASAERLTLVLEQVDLIDASGAAMLAGILDAPGTERSPWSFVDVDPVVHTDCGELRGCACGRLRSSIGPARPVCDPPVPGIAQRPEEVHRARSRFHRAQPGR